jgi:hypothetical protein
MRLRYGAIPEDSDFDPNAAGWRKIRFDPDPILLQVIAVPVAVFLVAIWGILFFVVLPVDVSPLQMLGSGIVIIGWIPIILLLIPVHELLHALVHPQWGRSSNTIIGVWLTKGVIYAHYEGEMSRNRFMLVALTPYLFLGLLPLGLLALPGAALWSTSAVLILGVVSLLGSVLACGDIVAVGLLLFQIPNAAVVRNKGWHTYWKSPVS